MDIELPPLSQFQIDYPVNEGYIHHYRRVSILHIRLLRLTPSGSAETKFLREKHYANKIVGYQTKILCCLIYMYVRLVIMALEIFEASALSCLFIITNASFLVLKLFAY